MSSIEDELQRVGDSVTLSELTLAIQRLQEDEPTRTAKVRKTNMFLGMLSEQLNLPGLFTLPSGRHFVYKQGSRYRTKSALPEYMTSEEAQPVADRDLIPEEARNLLEEAGIVSGARTFPVDPPPEIRATPLNPADGGGGDGRETPTTTGGSALERFASSGKGGLRNDPDEVEAIRELQTFLVNDLGLDTGGIDGRYGPRTRAAVRRFQGAVTDIVQDGDAGPETIGKITEIRRDMSRIQELIDALNESALPVRFKSGLAQLLERDLTQTERTELQNLLDKYENFRQTFPDFNSANFATAENVVTGAAEIAAPAGATQAPSGPFLDGMVVTPEVNDRLQAVGRQPGAMGEPLDAEDIAALNRGVADGTITAPAEVSPEETTAQTSAEWEELTPNNAPEGYTIFIKRQATPVFTYGLEGGEPVDREYNSLEDATAAARAAQEEERAATQQPAQDEVPSAAESDWEDITNGSAMIDGYSLWRRKAAPRNYTFTVAGSEPAEDAEEFNVPALAIAAARRARSAATSTAPSGTAPLSTRSMDDRTLDLIRGLGTQ